MPYCPRPVFAAGYCEVISMKYPKLVRPEVCRVPIHVTIYDEGISEEGEPIVAFEADLKCNYQDSAKTVLTAEKKLIQLSGSALLDGDIAPELAVLSGGTVTVNGTERQIYQGYKARNPDGTVNYTRLDVV